MFTAVWARAPACTQLAKNVPSLVTAMKFMIESPKMEVQASEVSVMYPACASAAPTRAADFVNAEISSGPPILFLLGSLVEGLEIRIAALNVSCPRR
mmetsp:Transcript_29231/g.58348  ORF Transcript_29231/g.58348 Transcript_29231/m.58348 type:complete len:97 (+) Transcript_29231:266-556(+)